MSITHHFDRKLFVRAFRAPVSTRHFYQCSCGACFNNHTLDDLEDMGGGIEIIEIQFEGKRFADECDCWVERAQKIHGFIMTHSNEIVRLIKGHVDSAIHSMPDQKDINTLVTKT